MFSVRLHLGNLGLSGLSQMLPNLDALIERTRQAFSAGSGGDIDIEIVPGITDINSSLTTDTFALHQAAENLTGNDPTVFGPVKNISLIFAGTYAPDGNVLPKMLGLMYDRGFVTSDDPQELYTKVPREGCAIFVQSIAKIRPKHADFEQEVFFNVVHELGHVFNLGHLNGSKNFMAQSQEAAPYPASYLQFAPLHRPILASCSRDIHVQPGGSLYEGLGGSANMALKRNSSSPPAARHSALSLKIRAQPSEFFAYEPVELEMSLSLDKESHRQMRFWDRLDPAYDCFSIWIETPERERYRYRATKFFCGEAGFRVLEPGQTFRRDISIFGQSGGYTFRQTGRHRLWVEFSLTNRSRVRSNTIAVSVLPIASASKRDLIRLDMLRRGGRELFYRAGDPRSTAVAAISRVAQDYKGHWSAAAALYALGRLHLRAGLRRKNARLRAKGITLLKKAEQRAALSPHRRRRAADLIAQHKT